MSSPYLLLCIAVALYNFQKLPYFRIKDCLGGVRDMQFHDYEHRFGALNYYVREKSIFESEWLPTSGTQPTMQILLEYPFEEENIAPEKQISDEITLILTLDIEFGKIGYGNIPEPVKYAGTGKVVRVG